MLTISALLSVTTADFLAYFNEIYILSQEEQHLPSVHKETHGHTDQLYAECWILLEWLLLVDRLFIQASRSEEHNKDRRILHSINILDALCGLNSSSECRLFKNPLVRKYESMGGIKWNNRLQAKRKQWTSEIIFWSIGIIISHYAACRMQ